MLISTKVDKLLKELRGMHFEFSELDIYVDYGDGEICRYEDTISMMPEDIEVTEANNTLPTVGKVNVTDNGVETDENLANNTLADSAKVKPPADPKQGYYYKFLK